MIKLDVEVPHVRGCRSPEVTGAASQVIGGEGQQHLMSHQHVPDTAQHFPRSFSSSFSVKWGMIVVPAWQSVCEDK